MSSEGSIVVARGKIQFEKGTTYAGIKKGYSPAAYLIPHPKDAAFDHQHPDYRQEFYKNKSNASVPTRKNKG
jgi:hypothetical protein